MNTAEQVKMRNISGFLLLLFSVRFVCATHTNTHTIAYNQEASIEERRRKRERQAKKTINRGNDKKKDRLKKSGVGYLFYFLIWYFELCKTSNYIWLGSCSKLDSFTYHAAYTTRSTQSTDEHAIFPPI